jgi:hypothetical protein
MNTEKPTAIADGIEDLGPKLAWVGILAVVTYLFMVQ